MEMSRSVDELGRIVIPAKMREAMQVFSGAVLDIELRDDEIILRNHQDTCRLCGNPIDLKRVKKNYVCGECIAAIKEM